MEAIPNTEFNKCDPPLYPHRAGDGPCIECLCEVTSTHIDFIIIL